LRKEKYLRVQTCLLGFNVEVTITLSKSVVNLVIIQNHEGISLRSKKNKENDETIISETSQCMYVCREHLLKIIMRKPSIIIRMKQKEKRRRKIIYQMFAFSFSDINVRINNSFAHIRIINIIGS